MQLAMSIEKSALPKNSRFYFYNLIKRRILVITSTCNVTR